MDSQLLKQVVIDQQSIKLPSNFISRNVHQKIVTLEKSKQIVVITGLRRCGKSTLLQEIRNNNSGQKSYYINFDDDRLIQFSVEDFQLLWEVFIELFGQQNIFYFDEIQNIAGWERFIRRLRDYENKIYITGSNSTMFSKELGTRLTGRYEQVDLYPFSFNEYVATNKPTLTTAKQQLTTVQTGLLREFFNKYLANGGIPEYMFYEQTTYLQSLYESILYRDIIARYRVNERAIKELVFYLASNVGKEITYNSIRKLLGLGSSVTIADYCHHLENSFLCFFINRYDFSLKKQIHYAKKVYFIDHALAKTVGFRFGEDRGRLLENVVFIELKRRGKEIYFHKQKYECDFLTKENTKITAAIQVTSNLNLEETKLREINGLLDAMELYGLEVGYIITEQEHKTEQITHHGKNYQIHIIPIWLWLSNE